MKLKEWLRKIADYRSEEEILEHLREHATKHIDRKGINQKWIDSMINLCFIYNLQKNGIFFKEKDLFCLLEKYKRKHNSEI